MVYFFEFFFRYLFVFCKHAPVPTGPDRRRIHITMSLQKSHRRMAVFREGSNWWKIVQAFHKLADLLFNQIREIAGPVVLIAQAPNDHRRVVVNAVRSYWSASVLPAPYIIATQATAAPGNFFPNHDT